MIELLKDQSIVIEELMENGAITYDYFKIPRGMEEEDFKYGSYTWMLTDLDTHGSSNLSLKDMNDIIREYTSEGFPVLEHAGQMWIGVR